MRRVVVGSVLFAVACTAPNPAFGDGSAEGTRGSSDTSGPGNTLDPSSAATATVTDSQATTSRGEDSSGRVDDGTEEETTDPARPDAGAECRLEGPDIDAEVRLEGQTVDRCAAQIPVQGMIVGIDPDVLSLDTCASCLQCEGVSGTTWTLEVMGFSIPENLAIGECVDVTVDRHIGDNCDLRSLAISRYRGGVWEPAVMAAHDSPDVVPNPAAPDGLVVPLSEQSCKLPACDQDSGQYSLDFTDERYFANDDPAMVPLFGRAEQFDLEVRTAYVDEDCQLQVAWLASLTR